MKELLTQKESILMVNRIGKGSFPTGVEVKAGDAYDASAIATLVKEADIVYQATQTAYTQWSEKFPTLHPLLKVSQEIMPNLL